MRKHMYMYTFTHTRTHAYTIKTENHDDDAHLNSKSNQPIREADAKALTLSVKSNN